jgi:hypothetical protein
MDNYIRASFVDTSSSGLRPVHDWTSATHSASKVYTLRESVLSEELRSGNLK